jgi:hypothetical protein
MASFNKFQDFVEQFGKGVHQLHAAGHTLKVYLTNDTGRRAGAPELDLSRKAQFLPEWRNRVAILTASIDVDRSSRSSTRDLQVSTINRSRR